MEYPQEVKQRFSMSEFAIQERGIRRAKKLLFKEEKHICSECRSKENIQAHHKDRNRSNNKLNNFAILCSKCHRNIHKYMSKLERGNMIDSLFTKVCGHWKDKTTDNLIESKSINQIFEVECGHW